MRYVQKHILHGSTWWLAEGNLQMRISQRCEHGNWQSGIVTCRASNSTHFSIFHFSITPFGREVMTKNIFCMEALGGWRKETFKCAFLNVVSMEIGNQVL